MNEPDSAEHGSAQPAGAEPAGANQARSIRTREQLIAAARELFGSHGYPAVSLDQVVAAAGVTKGALYHHFPRGKKQLLDSVYEAVEAEATVRIGAGLLARPGGQESGAEPDLMALIDAAIDQYFEIGLDPEIRQIVYQDAPAVLGWARWREVAAEHGLGLVEQALRAAIEAGQMRPVPVLPMAHLLIASLSEAAMLISQSPDHEAAREEAIAAVKAVIEGLRADDR